MYPSPRLSPECHTHISSHLLNISESSLARPIDKSRRILVSQLFSHLQSHFPARLLCLGVLAFLFTCCSGQKILPLPTDFWSVNKHHWLLSTIYSVSKYFFPLSLPHRATLSKPATSCLDLCSSLSAFMGGCPLVSPSPQPRYGEDNNSGVRVIKKKNA